MSKEKFNPKFLLSLFASAVESKIIASTLVQYVEDDFLPNKEYQKILHEIKKGLRVNNKVPSLNLLFQKFDDDDDVYYLLEDIENTEITISNDEIIEELQIFLENVKFIKSYTEIGKLFNKGKKSEAVSKLKGVSEELQNFSIKKEVFDPVVSNFAKRNLDAMTERALDNSTLEKKVMFGIEELDKLTKGIDTQQVICLMAASGGGKTKAMRYIASVNARRGLNVLHVQLEGSHKEAVAGYGATFSGVHSSTIQTGNIDTDKLSDLEKSFLKIEGEVFVKTFEQFAKSPTTADVHKMIADAQKAHKVKMDLVVIDYMELLNTADNRNWSPNDERHRRTQIADEMKDISVEYDNVVLTATQANDIPINDLNNENFYLTRHNVSEAKGIIKPLTMFLTINRTYDEIQGNRARVWLDKSRFTASSRMFTIATDYARDRFYDRKRTSEMSQITEE